MIGTDDPEHVYYETLKAAIDENLALRTDYETLKHLNHSSTLTKTPKSKHKRQVTPDRALTRI
jgi:hypothetical protein